MQQESAAPNVAHKVASGTLLLLIARFATKSLDVVMLIFLTRVLLPADFGLVAIAMTVVRVAEAIFDAPFSVALLQVPKLTRSHLDTAFTLGLVRGAIISVILAAASIPLANFYEDRRLALLTCALAFAPMMRGLRSPRLYQQFNELRFGPDMMSEIIGKTLALAAAVALAIKTESYWAIAVGAIGSTLFQMIASYFLSPYLPSLSLRHRALFHRFVGWGMAGQLLSSLNWQGDRFVLGKMVSQSELGHFTIARDVASTAFKLITEVVSRSAMAGLAHVREDRPRLARAYEKTSSALLAIGIPISVGQAFVAEELITLLLGDKWAQSVPIFQAVSFTLIPALYANLTNCLFYALNRPELVFTRNLYDLIFRIPATIVMIMMFGIRGAVAAVIVSDILLAVICLRSVKQLVGISMIRQALIPWRSFCGAAMMAAVIELCRWVAPHSPGGPAALIFLLTAMPLAAISYGATHLLVWHLAGRPEGVETDAFGIARGYLRRQQRQSGIL